MKVKSHRDADSLFGCDRWTAFYNNAADEEAKLTVDMLAATVFRRLQQCKQKHECNVRDMRSYHDLVVAVGERFSEHTCESAPTTYDAAAPC